MATDTQAPDVDPASEYSVVTKPRGRQIDPEARVGPTCMIWGVVLGISLMICMTLTWVIPHLGSLDWGLIFRQT